MKSSIDKLTALFIKLFDLIICLKKLDVAYCINQIILFFV